MRQAASATPQRCSRYFTPAITRCCATHGVQYKPRQAGLNCPFCLAKGYLALRLTAAAVSYYCWCYCLSHLPGTIKPCALLAVEPSAPVCLGLRRGQGALIHATVDRESVYLHSATRQKTGRARERQNPRNINTEATGYVTDGEVRDIARSGRCGASPVLFSTARLGGGGCAEWAEEDATKNPKCAAIYFFLDFLCIEY